MGMFDTVLVYCPHCRQEDQIQTKAGECTLKSSLLNHDPALTISVLGAHYCENCNNKYYIQLVSRPWAVARRAHDCLGYHCTDCQEFAPLAMGEDWNGKV